MPVKVYSGDTWERSWLLKDAAGVPVPLENATARLQVRSRNDILIAASTEDGRIVITPELGELAMVIPYAYMDIRPGTYNFALEITHASGVRRTYEQDTLVVLEDVTRG